MATKKGSEKTKAEQAGGESAEPAITFEKAMERLEVIVGDMEGGALSLEEMIKRFEEGQGLIKFCTRKLNEVEKKVEMLVKKGDQFATEDFDAPATDAPADKEPDEELF